jgi:hypothetical protein
MVMQFCFEDCSFETHLSGNTVHPYSSFVLKLSDNVGGNAKARVNFAFPSISKLARLQPQAAGVKDTMKSTRADLLIKSSKTLTSDQQVGVRIPPGTIRHRSREGG